MINQKIGTLIVITGAAGAGKDAVMEGFLKNPRIKKFNIEKIVSYTDRPMRPGEKEGVEHFFVTNAKLKELEAKGEFVEPITKTGISNKATPKSEILKLLNGKNLIWRIDPIRGTEVISGRFFDKLFSKYAKDMNSHTLVFFITAPKKMLEERRKNRDQKQYSKAAYELRQKEEEPLLKVLEEQAIKINNLDGKLDQAIDSVVNSYVRFNNKNKVNKVLVGGCFDILHYGHIHFLKKAKTLGDYLIVALESDENIKKIKGKNRPIHTQNQRREMLESLEFVDEVINLQAKMKDEDYFKLVETVHPQIIAVTEGDPVLSKKQKQAKSIGAKVIEISKIIVPSTSQIAKILKIE